MIGRLRGNLVEKNAPTLIVELHSGLGYELDAPMSTFYNLPELGNEITLYTHQVVREDAQLLYGFASKQERTLFRALIKINGIGPKLALTILSTFSVDEFVACVQQDDLTNLVRVPGVGKKTAERLLIEMRGKLGDWQVSLPQPVVTSGTEQDSHQEAVSALIALGYKPQDASRAVSKVNSETQVTEELIRLALREMLV